MTFIGSPGKRITLGIIGCGNQSTVDIPEFLKNYDCQIVAVCDVNRASHGYRNEQRFLGPEPQRDFVDDAASQMFVRPLRAPWSYA